MQRKRKLFVKNRPRFFYYRRFILFFFGKYCNLLFIYLVIIWFITKCGHLPLLSIREALRFHSSQVNVWHLSLWLWVAWSFWRKSIWNRFLVLNHLRVNLIGRDFLCCSVAPYRSVTGMWSIWCWVLTSVQS